MKPFTYYLLLTLPVIILLSSCEFDDDDDPEPDTYYPNKILIIVDDNVYTSVKSDVQDYIDDIQTYQNTTGYIYKWTTGTVEEMREVIQDYYETDTIKGVFLIGDLPVAWYEMESDWKEHEEFPFDLYLMDIDATWTDSDGNGKYDDYSSLVPDIFVSRIEGSSSQIENYLGKVHDFRTSGPLTNKSAYLFIDDDWRSMYASEDFNINYIYDDLEIDIDLTETTKASYIQKMNQGVEYVHQMIHTYPASMVIDGESGTENITTAEIEAGNYKACFYQMFNCSGSRFTQECLAMTYVMKTTYGLATQGTTKTGGNYYPQDFNSRLSYGDCWGDAFIYWFNGGGHYLADKWKMGLVLLGDPLLMLSEPTKKAMANLNEVLPENINMKELERIMKEQAEKTEVLSFEDYKAEHPEFFKD